MFIVEKLINKKKYYYLRENTRVKGKVKSKDIAYLGKIKAQALIKMKEIENIKNLQSTKINMIEKEIKQQLTIDELSTFCKRKGFVFKSSEIYGGLSGFWDYGPLGIELFNNLKQNFWKFFVHEKENMVGIDASIISHPKTWLASGHIASFSDVSVRCRKCKKYNKVDKAELETAKCGFCSGELDKPSAKDLNLMLKTSIGPVEEESLSSYLRPETAQGMFLDFKQIVDSGRVKLPFGIVQIGKCFRNEIAPRDFLFRCREFSIGEFEFFIHPEKDNCELLDNEHLNLKFNILDAETQVSGKTNLKETTISKMLQEKKLGNWHAYWLAEQLLWFKQLGLLGNIKVREHMKSELSHYSSATFDMDYLYPFGSREIAGNANRGQYDLTQHQKTSCQNLEIFDESSKSRILPRVIEPTFGIDRVFLALLCQAYSYDEKRQNIVLKLPASLAPIKAAVLPIVKNDSEIVKISRDIFSSLKKEFNISYDDSASLGRRYSRNDEIGTPITITCDNQTPVDNTVTLRDRDTTEQVRVKIIELNDILRKVIFEGKSVLDFGKKVTTRVKEN